MATIHHLIIPVKTEEDVHRTRDFFVNVLGFKVVREGRVPKDMLPEENRDVLPDIFCHLYDDNGMCIDVAAFDKDCPYGKGIAIGVQVDNIDAAWNAIEPYPVRKTVKPRSYGEVGTQSLGLKTAYFGFFSLDVSKVSNDGPEQVFEICELNS